MKIRGFKVADYSPRPAPCPWNIRRRVEHRGAHQGRFHSPRRFSEARVRKKGPGAHGTALGRPGLVRTASQLFSGKLGANHITSTRNHAPIKPAAPATSHTNPHQPHHQHQKPRANQTSSPGNITHQPASTTSPAPEATRQSSRQPRQHHASTTSSAPHQPHHQRQNRASTTPPVMAEPHLQQQKPRANRITTIGNTTRQPPHQRRLHQRFLYCDGETPNISLKYFAKYFCVPKPTASETSTTLSPASADNSWAALLSRMVRMNTEGFIP